MNTNKQLTQSETLDLLKWIANTDPLAGNENPTMIETIRAATQFITEARRRAEAAIKKAEEASHE